jgi:predicted RNase H-like HicB family nuclease
MEKLLNIHIEKLPEGYYLATSDELPGLVAQGRTVIETLEIARDVARKIIEAKSEREQANINLKSLQEEFDYALIVNN